jgi:hypothetical protein
MPGMPDPRFEEAVLALCMHDKDGALGIGVGQVLEGVTLHNLLDDLNIPTGHAPDCEVHHGGPVEPQRGFVLHSPDWEGEGTLLVCEQWSLTGSRDILVAIAEGRGPALAGGIGLCRVGRRAVGRRNAPARLVCRRRARQDPVRDRWKAAGARHGGPRVLTRRI